MARRRGVPWLLSGEVAVQFQTYRDLLGVECPDLQLRIACEGDAGAILTAHAEVKWGRGFYEPKWTCPHCSLLELRDLGVVRDHPICMREVDGTLERYRGGDGGFNPADSVKESDVCVDGMFLAFSCYFAVDAAALESVVDVVRDSGRRAAASTVVRIAPARGLSSVHSTTTTVAALQVWVAIRVFERRGL